MNANTPNFRSLLSRPAASIERPKPLPVGTYLATVGSHRFDKSAKKGTDFVEFELNIVQPQEDVDAEALVAFGSVTGKKQRLTFYVTEDSLWRLTEFLKTLDLVADETSSIEELLPQTANRPVLAKIKHTPSENGEVIYAEIASTMRADV